MVTMTLIGATLVTLFSLEEKGKIVVNPLIVKLVLVGIAAYGGWMITNEIFKIF